MRLRLAAPGFATTGVPDEWVAMVVPGQYQSRYYTVRGWGDGELVLDVVIHDEGLVTEWVAGGCVGQTVELAEPQGSFTLPPGAQWLLLVGDLTALPAMARIVETTRLPTRIWAQVPDDLASYFPADADVAWTSEPLADLVEGLDWPSGEGYFWMAGESAQMRAIRKYLMRVRKLPSSAYNVMGYWRTASARPRPVSAGQDWAAYDSADEVPS